ncbi:hypothetical protein GHA01_18190 [Novacetimonas hansenii]|uniref:Uncharacterized protein n=1 Tax=Novacetimonas hansenii TaxID=436 RepID=A0ABQ0SF78_NOVHA|nr:hypothetical protein Gaha_0026_008 [Novacetimonas hansenii JCM 7643]GEC63970.1 hypothetical protein GHA01_18190 [Novacetimonas hansenii]
MHRPDKTADGPYRQSFATGKIGQNGRITGHGIPGHAKSGSLEVYHVADIR